MRVTHSAEIDALWDSPFGAELFNAYTITRNPDLFFSQRALVVRTMLLAMLQAEKEIGATWEKLL